ncbi:subtilisin-like protease SBT4.15 [Rosa chinensis]|nr:subtilisin-like protease SBT4.15 [Rosa chinensis]
MKLKVSTCVVATLAQGTNEDGSGVRKPYIVYMGELPEPGSSTMVMTTAGHDNLLKTAIGDADLARVSKIYTYGRSFNGFVARLLPHEAKKLSDDDRVVSVFPNTKLKLHTTRSWDFLGLPGNTKKRNLPIESKIVVGVIDTGIWPACPSMNDSGFGPPPRKWKGKCMKGGNFTGCNNKVIGAKYFMVDDMPGPGYEDNASPVDTDGHGTHTASIVGGVPVRGASLYGIAKGTARGGAPSSRIATYKACWTGGCGDMNILAAFDEAIADGVDLISISIGGPSRNFLQDSIALGSFHAMKRGILVSASAGNDGPYASSVQNVAPWIMTVAATGLDRRLKTLVKLGNGKKISGNSINTFTPKKQMYPLTSGARASNVTSDLYGNASACDTGTLNPQKVKGRIVLCKGQSNQDPTIKDLNGAGTIMTEDEMLDYGYTPIIPATYVLVNDGLKIERYINTTKNPTAVIQRTRTVHMDAPFIASFSSRGPQLITPNILKPDLAAPGINILAAYSKLPSLTGSLEDMRHYSFNILSGTSMSCPHATASAAYVKSFHPDWSPAAIKSALMTTATPLKIKPLEGELAFGAGQIQPIKAVHPGLVYDISMNDYISFLCKEGYNSTSIGKLIGGKKKYNCSDFKPAPGTDGLNYPSMSYLVRNPNSSISAVFLRSVKHVGYGKSVYKAKVTSPKGLSIRVTPSTLTFTKKHQKRSFTVVVKGGTMKGKTESLSALLEWDDGRHTVRSPIVVYRHTTS